MKAKYLELIIGEVLFLFFFRKHAKHRHLMYASAHRIREEMTPQPTFCRN
jgi:hypothetical protein